jgi:uncharacterized protein
MSESAPPTKAQDPAPATDPKLLELLVCPLTKMPLIFDREAKELISRTAGLAFPIRHGVPLMTEDAARPLNDDDYRKLEQRG